MSFFRDKHSETGPNSIKGVLLLFCLILTIFLPMGKVFAFICEYNILKLHCNVSDISFLAISYGFLNVFLLVFSIYAGVTLWKIRYNAVRTAKIFLLVYFGCSIILIVLTFFSSVSSSHRSFLYYEAGKSLIFSISFFIVWYWYLCKSKRVEFTFAKTFR